VFLNKRLVLVTPNGPELGDRVICTLEVMDASGKTVFALNNPKMHSPPSE